jgi:hypothetical protein
LETFALTDHSSKAAVKAPADRRRRRGIYLGLLTIGLLVGWLYYQFYVPHRRWWKWEHPTPVTFNGPSTALQRTVIVPTLDSPIPAGKSTIWSASLQMTWNELKRVVGGPVHLKHAESLSNVLNQSAITDADLPRDMYYAAAGWFKDGIADKIAADMRSRFPEMAPPHFSTGPGGLAYAFLRPSVAFTYPYAENPEPLTFHDSNDGATRLASFGITESSMRQDLMRDQIEVLFAERAENNNEFGSPPVSFGLDLCKDSRPNQVLLAWLPRQATLAQAVGEVQRLAARTQADRKRFHYTDTLLVPTMHWRIDHRFSELEGTDKTFDNPALAAMHMDRWPETIEFKLDKSGAELITESLAVWASVPVDFRFERPFLIIMQTRGASHPFFAMWVDNAELLQPWPAKP